jgi:hypothetical protein
VPLVVGDVGAGHEVGDLELAPGEQGLDVASADDQELVAAHRAGSRGFGSFLFASMDSHSL